MRHDLKTWPEPYAAVVRGEKTHEARRNDRIPAFAAGDTLCLREWEPDAPEACAYEAKGLTGRYTGNSIVALVTYVTGGGEYGLPADLCVMSIRRVSL